MGAGVSCRSPIEKSAPEGARLDDPADTAAAGGSGYSVIDRRAFLCGFTLSAMATPLAAEAQPARKVPRIGVIGESSQADPWVEAFRLGLRELGYAEGGSILVDYRYLYNALERVP